MTAGVAPRFSFCPRSTYNGQVPSPLAEKDVIDIDSPLPIKKKEKKPAWKRVVLIVLRVVVGITIVLAALYSIEIIWLYSVYTPFYVVGDSMWPTLNSDARREAGGEATHAGDWGNYSFGTSSWYTIDFGFMDTTDFLPELERFDVVVTHYPDDPPGVGYKIKRIVGLPGETIYFDAEGELYIKGLGESQFELIPQVGFAMRDKDKTNFGSEYAYNEEHAYEIPEGSYFIVGDNRSASTDSRSVGAIGGEYMRGKAIYVVGTCQYTADVANGRASPGVNWLSFVPPWAFQEL